MSGGLHKLVGVVRVMPICTFVTPVFQSDNGVVYQHIDEDGRIQDFVPIAQSDQVLAFATSLVAQLGGAALFAFETEPGEFSIGTAARLKSDLRREFLTLGLTSRVGERTLNRVRHFVESEFRVDIRGSVSQFCVARCIPEPPPLSKPTFRSASRTTLEADTSGQESLGPDSVGGIPSLPRRLSGAILSALGNLVAAMFLLAFSVAVLPAIGAISIAVAMSGRPIIFRHPRVGRDGDHFSCYQFRTMINHADVALQTILQNDPELRVEWERDHQLRNDPRVTRIGRFLRRTGLDKLPQLWNALKGEMAFVGPSPVGREELLRYGRNAETYMLVKPGMTGLWQVSGRAHFDYRVRVAMDICYVRNRSFVLDAWICFKALAKFVNTSPIGTSAFLLLLTFADGVILYGVTRVTPTLTNSFANVFGALAGSIVVARVVAEILVQLRRKAKPTLLGASWDSSSSPHRDVEQERHDRLVETLETMDIIPSALRRQESRSRKVVG